MKLFARKRALASLLVSLGLLLCVGVVAGCGGGGSSSSSSSGSTEAAETTGNSESTGTEESSGFETAAVEKKLAPFLTPPSSIMITEPLPQRPVGKLVEYLECSATPCKTVGIAFKKASEVMGLKYKAIQAGATPESFQAAAEQALQDKPAAVLMAGIPQELIKDQLAQMKAQGIVTYDQATTNPPGATTISFLDTTYYKNVGAAAARYMALQSGGKANVLYVNQSIWSFGNAQGEGMKETLESECPECTYTEIDSQPEEIGSKIPSKVVSELQAKPATNWIYFCFGEMSLGVPQALNAASIEGMEIMSQAGAENNYEGLKKGEEKAILESSTNEVAWYVIDTVSRAIEGEEPANNIEHANFAHVIEGEDITFDPNSELYEANPNYQKELEQLWGLK